MATTVEERLAEIEARLSSLEGDLLRSRRPRIGMTIEEVKERLKHPVVYGPEQMELLRDFIGSFDGPEDLSERMRDYINGDLH